MPTGNTAVQDLGHLAQLDARGFEAGVILWDRFCVVGDRREHERTTVVAVTDLERKLGDSLTHHRLELHLLPEPSGPEEQARLTRAVAIRSRVQPRVYALGRTGGQLVLVCEPALGRPLDGVRAIDGDRPLLEQRKLMALGVELAGLIAELHAADVHGVRITRGMLRVEDGHFNLDRFTHLLHDERDSQRDVAALLELLRELGDEQAVAALASLPTGASELREAFGSLTGTSSGFELELPPDPPFVGRTRALTELARGFDQAQIAQPASLVVRGQRGVGKSRLLSEFVAARLDADDSIVLTGAWQERSADSRGGLLSALEQLTQALGRLGPDERDDVRRRINRATRHLGAIVTRSAPSLGAVLRNIEELPPLELGEDFSRHTAVIADLLRAIGTHKRPLVLVLDNLESIDASSAAVLKILTQHRPAHHTVVIMGLRTGAGYEPDFEFDPVDLAPLSAAEIEQLLRGVLPGEIADAKGLSEALWGISTGLPLVAWTNLRAWIDRGRLSRGLEDGLWRARRGLRDETERQLGVRDVFGSRLNGASAPARLLALQVAVLGAELGDEDIRALTQSNSSRTNSSQDNSSRDNEDALDELISLGILGRTPVGVRFPHDSIRELVFETFSEAERRNAHNHAAELLAQQKAPIAQIAYHRDLALDPSTPSSEAFDRLSRLHVDAGRERLAVYDLERARWHLERALEHSRDPEQRSLAAEGLADICLLSDDIDTAVSLYTAIIATSEPAHAVHAAAKSVSFLWSKALSIEARQLGNMALEAVSEPIPSTPIGKLVTLIGAVFRSWFVRPKLSTEIREALCRLYPWMTLMSLVDDPVAMPMYVARSHWIAKSLASGPASMVQTIEGSMWAALGRFNRANRIFASSHAIADEANDPWAQGWAKHHWGHVSLLPSDRYEEGQDMLDDAIAAFRETGDVSISILSIMFKGLYGRDREPAEVVLGWFEEATATARRNGKFVASAPLEALKLQVLARQGRTDLLPRLEALTRDLEGEDMSGIERLMARVYLAFAAYEAKVWDIAVAQVRAGQADLGDLPGVPEYCSEIHLVTALVMLERPMPTQADRKMLRHAVRKFRTAAKRSPRLRVLGEFLELVLALHGGNGRKARAIASKVVAEFDVHENLYVAREAHRALSRLLKGENVLAAAEHDRVARNLGRRLGLQEHALLSDFSEVEEEVGMLALGIESALKLEESQHDIPAAGMLTSAVQQSRTKRPASTTQAVVEQSDVLEAWALTSTTPPQTVLGDVLTPVREAVSASIEGSSLTLECRDPSLEVPISSGDLQIVMISLVLTCRDAAGGNVGLEVWLEPETITNAPPKTIVGAEDDIGASGPPTPPPGRYLAIRVTAPSPANRVPIFGAFSNTERLVQSVGGHLSATTTRKQIALTARVPLELPTAAPVEQRAQVVIVHPEAAVCETISTALEELGVDWRVYEPENFDSTKVEQSTLLLADGDSLESFAVFEPLFDVRIVEIVKRGAEPINYGRSVLRVPFALSDLEDKLR